MKYITTTPGLTLAAILLSWQCHAQDLPDGYWSAEQADSVLRSTRTVVLDPDLSQLTAEEQSAVQKLLSAGRIINRIYEDSLHPQALAALQALKDLKANEERKSGLMAIYYRSGGPITTTLDNRREAFLPVAAEEPGKNVYPQGLTTEALNTFLSAHPDMTPAIMDLRSVVRAGTDENLQQDLQLLDRFPVLDELHPGLRSRLEAARSAEGMPSFYALPYSVRWAPEIMQAYRLVMTAAVDMQKQDPDFSDYLSLRARDLLSDNYEGGDAAWVRGRFGRLNAQIGSYEVYPDSLYGVKSFFSLSLLARDEAKSLELSAALKGLQDIQDRLPNAPQRKIQDDISVGVYNVIADFGQSRGANTATILPNDADHTRKYGRTILLRYNIMMDPGLFEDRLGTFKAAVKPGHAGELTIEGPFNRTLWHEVGHYLGVDVTVDGRDLNEALSPWGSHFEELKADLVSAFTAAQLNESGLMGDAVFRSVQAASVLRVLQKNQPRTSEQPYQTMQLMQMNYFLERGLLKFDPTDDRLSIDYGRYNEVIAQMLGDVLAIQLSGDSQRAAEFIQNYTSWTPELHDRLAGRLRDSSNYRFVMVRYSALGDE